jgi:TonB family protein
MAMTMAAVLVLSLMLPRAGRANDGPVQDRRAVVHRTQPNYPELAKRLNLCGVVMVKAAVAADGHVKSATVASGNPILGQAASAAVREWVFVPGTEETVTIDITFSLHP